MTFRGSIATTLLILFVSLIPRATYAQEYDEATIEKVNTHFETGADLYYDEKYEEAIAEFEAGHALIPNAIFLYNISLAYERMGETEKALQKAEEAEEMGGLSEQERVSNRARIAALQRTTTATELAETRRTPSPLVRFTHWGWIGSGLVAGGLLALAGTLSVDAALSDDVDAYRDAAQSGNRAEYDRLADDIKRRQTGGRVLFFLGTAGVIGGTGLIVYDLMFNPNNRPAETPQVALIPGRGGASLQLRWTW